MSVPKIDLLAFGDLTEAHRLLAKLRENHSVVEASYVDSSIFLVLRYEEAKELLTNSRYSARPPEGVTSPGPPISPASQPYFDSFLVRTEGNDHARLKRLLSLALSPRLVSLLQPGVEREAAELCTQLADSVRIGRGFDLVESYSFKIAMTSLSRVLGIPDDALAPWEFVVARVNGVEALSDPAIYSEAFDEMVALAKDVVRSDQLVADGLLQTLVAEHEAVDLGEEQLVATVLALVFAGHETTARLISCLIETAFRDPVQHESLRQITHVRGRAFDDLIRVTSPIETANIRWALDKGRLGNFHVEPGMAFMPIIFSANHDADAFQCPGRIEADRSRSHLAFGYGRHYCPGAELGSMTARIATHAFLSRFNFDDIVLASAENARIYGVGIRHLDFLPA